jgi:hypothetical protein
VAAASRIKLLNIAPIMITAKPCFLEEWIVNTFKAERQDYFIVTEGISLFSILFPAKGITTVSLFERVIDETLAKLVKAFSEDFNVNEAILKDKVFSKTENTYLRKNQSDQIDHAKRYAKEGKSPIQINKMPLKELGFKTPEEVLFIEMGKLLRLNGYIWVSNSIRN